MRIGESPLNEDSGEQTAEGSLQTDLANQGQQREHQRRGENRNQKQKVHHSSFGKDQARGYSRGNLAPQSLDIHPTKDRRSRARVSTSRIDRLNATGVDPTIECRADNPKRCL